MVIEVVGAVKVT